MLRLEILFTLLCLVLVPSTSSPTAQPSLKTTPSPSTEKPTSKVTPSPSTTKPTSKTQAPTTFKTAGPTSSLHPAGTQILGYLVATSFTGDGKGVGEELCNLPNAMPQNQVALATGVCIWSSAVKEYVMYNVTELHANESTATTIHMTIDKYGPDKLCSTSTSHKSISQTLGCVAAGSGNLTSLATDLPLGPQATYLSFNTGDSFPSFYFSGVVAASYPSKAACTDEAAKPYRFSSAVADVCIPDAGGKTSSISSCVSGSGFYTLTSFPSSPSCSGQFSVSQKALTSPMCNAESSSPGMYEITGCGSDPFDFSYSSISGWLVKSTDVSPSCNSPVSANFEPLGQCSIYSDDLYALRTIEFKSASNATVVTTTYSDSTCTADATPVSRVSVLLGTCFSNTSSSSKHFFSYSYFPGGAYPTQAAISSGYGISKATSAADCTAQVNIVGYSILATNVCFMSGDGSSSYSYSCSNAQPVKKTWASNTQCAGTASSATSISDNCFHGTGGESTDFYYNSFCSKTPALPMVQGYYGQSSYMKMVPSGACYGMTQQVYTALGLCTQYSGTKYSRSWYVRLGVGDALVNKTITYSSLANCQAGKGGLMTYSPDTSLTAQYILSHSCYQGQGYTSMFSLSTQTTPPTATFSTEAFGLSAVPSQSQCGEQNEVSYLIYQASEQCVVDPSDNSSLSVSCVGEGFTYYTAFPPNTFCNFTNAYNDVNIYVNAWPWQQTVSWNSPPCSSFEGDYITYFCGNSPNKALLAEANKKAAEPISSAQGFLEIKTYFYDEQQQHTDVDPVAPCTLDLPVKQDGVPVGLCLPFYPPSLDLAAQPLYFYIVSGVQDSTSGISWKEKYFTDFLCTTVSASLKEQTVIVKSKACSPVGSSPTVYQSVTYTPVSQDANMSMAVLSSAASSIGLGTAVYNSGASCAGVQPSAYTSYSTGFCGTVQGGSVQYSCAKTSLTKPPDALMRFYALSSNCTGGYIVVRINFSPNASLPLCLGSDQGASSFFCNGFPVALPTEEPTPVPSPSPLRLPSFSPSLSLGAPTLNPAPGSNSVGSLANEQDLTQSQIDGFAAGAAVVVAVLAIFFYFRCRRLGAGGSNSLASQDASSPGSPQQRQHPSLARGGSANASNFGFAPKADHGAMRLSAGSVISSRASDVIPNPVFEAAAPIDTRSPHGDL